jgi:hypothetical protein
VIRTSRRTRIVVETERLLIVRSGRGESMQWCEACGEVVRMVRLDEAALVTGSSQRDLVHRLDAGSLHFVELSRGVLLICLSSLLPEERT